MSDHVFEDSEGAPWPEEIQDLANEIERDWDGLEESVVEKLTDLMTKVEAAVRDYYVQEIDQQIALAQEWADGSFIRENASAGNGVDNLAHKIKKDVFDVLPDPDLNEMRRELAQELARAMSSGDLSVLERLVHEWQMAAAVYSDPVSRAILADNVSDDDFVEVDRPADPSGTR